MNIGDESQMCPTCEELEWQCQCPPEPDEIVNPTPDDYYDEPMRLDESRYYDGE